MAALGTSQAFVPFVGLRLGCTRGLFR